LADASPDISTLLDDGVGTDVIGDIVEEKSVRGTVGLAVRP
jgi:hypothetical protein